MIFYCLRQSSYHIDAFWPILVQKKTSLVVFLLKTRTSSVVYIGSLEIILWPKRQLNLLSFFIKNTTKLVFLWANMSQKSIRVLTSLNLKYIITGKKMYDLTNKYSQIFLKMYLNIFVFFKNFL